MTIEELSEKRRKHLQSKRENNDFSDETITNLYSKRSHFIYELIQNAEDEKATSVTFYLFKEKLIFEHNSKILLQLKILILLQHLVTLLKKVLKIQLENLVLDLSQFLQ